MLCFLELLHLLFSFVGLGKIFFRCCKKTNLAKFTLVKLDVVKFLCTDRLLCMRNFVSKNGASCCIDNF